MHEESIYIFVGVVVAIINIIVFIKFLVIATDIKTIRNILAQKEQANTEPKNPENDMRQVGYLLTKLDDDEALVRIHATKNLEIWSRENVEKMSLDGQNAEIEVLYKKY
jgi:cell division protein FtsN